MQLVQLGVAHAGGEVPHGNLAWPRIGQVDVVDDERLARLDENGGRRVYR